MKREGMKKKQMALVVIMILIFLAGLIFLGIYFFGDEENLEDLISQEDKPDSIAEQCAFACESGQKAAYCDVERTVGEDKFTCYELASNSRYNVQSCSSILCEEYKQEKESIDQTCVTGLGGTWETPVNGICPQSGSKVIREITPSDNPPSQGQICCR